MTGDYILAPRFFEIMGAKLRLSESFSASFAGFNNMPDEEINAFYSLPVRRSELDRKTYEFKHWEETLELQLIEYFPNSFLYSCTVP